MRIKYLICLISILLIAGLSCEGDSSRKYKSSDGPQVTPEDIELKDDPEPVSDLTDTSVIEESEKEDGQNLDGDEDSDDLSIVSEKEEIEPEDGDTPPEDESDDSGITSDPDSDTEEVATGEKDTDKTVDPLPLDIDFPEEGGWYITPPADLVGTSPDKVSENNEKINTYRAEIKSLREKIKETSSKNEIKEIRNTIRQYSQNIMELRKNTGAGYSTVKGFHSYHSNSAISITVPEIKDPGWYRVRVTAKNIEGPLPEWYRYFNVSIINENTGKDEGGIFIPASDSIYQSGSSLLYLDSGKALLTLTWTNDAWKEGEYSTNIQIRKISLKYAGKERTRQRLSRNTYQYNALDGRWFWNDEGAWTSWPEQYLGFTFPDLKAGKYRVTIFAKNLGTTPPDNNHFIINVDADGTGEQIKIKADSKKFKKGSAIIDLTGGAIDLFISWDREESIKGKGNSGKVKNKQGGTVNIEEDPASTALLISKIKLKRVGESRRSAIVAYLTGTKTGNRFMVGTVLAAMAAFFTFIFILNRKRAQKES